MSRLVLIWFIFIVLHSYCNRYSLAQDISQIQPTIEKERQIVRIRNKILKELVNNGAKISRSEATNRIEQIREQETVAKEEIKTDLKNDIKIGPVPQGTSKVMVTLGEPVSQARDKCLVFNIAKYIKNVEHIIPKKINLWIHLRKRGNQKSKKKKNKQSDKAVRAGATENQRGKENNDTARRKGRRKNRKRRHGRRIKLFISDGTKTLVKMRMRVSKTKWYKIELPISQFPDVISVNDSFTLCFKCKRCSKKVKMDLYRKGNRARELNTQGVAPETTTDPPTIPFIHFEEPRSHTVYRYQRSTDVIRRSSDVINNKRRRRHIERSRPSQNKKTCCSEDIYKEEISKLFPSILYPESINISLCAGHTDSFIDQPLLSQTNSSQTLSNDIECVPSLYEPFKFIYVNKHFKVKHASIPDLIPVGCSCRKLS
ncbi:uncharacterized protein LOC123531949 [Mercenaria mercenaria]|uniref:uncharacterized protein LOC123531949 n=1 Tax=Mercenaria mercenaria TaxID=6596 RepID=UPI001E1D53AC|nr:uncharacterized protein LOC123531949 [Mercenaria mercenaria]XP_053374718.1 uncharacterized protein LOC123531949 [Mercenaria mercenaria]